MRRQSHTFLILILLLSACDADVRAVSSCGDEFRDPGEECDGPDLDGLDCVSLGYYRSSGVLACHADCTFDVSDCGGRCGDGLIQSTRAEQCDGAVLDDQSCISLGYIGGSLSCGDDCRFDTSACESRCGNEMEEPNEACDGTALRGLSCAALGYSGGELACDDDCTFDEGGCQSQCGNGLAEPTEDCDGLNLRGFTCLSLGYEGGELGCESCRLNVSACEGETLCGNGIIDAGEECDGTEPGTGSCVGLGYTGGNLTCGRDCRFNVGRCVGSLCGNGFADPGETCDGADLRGVDCRNLGFGSGTLACSSGCRFLTAGCSVATVCGDSVVGPGESCDGTDFLGLSCSSYGYDQGQLRCEANCQVDASSCACAAACEESELRCQGSWLQQCRFDGSPCNSWEAVDDCAANGGQCVAIGDQAICRSMLFEELTTGADHACALDTTGGAWCWGANDSGQLGDGTVSDRLVPTPVSMPAGVNFTIIAGGGLHTCALDDAGAPWCWGHGGQGQLGDTFLMNRWLPVRALLPDGRVFHQICTGGLHACAVDDLGGVWCWGNNEHGQLGIGTSAINTSQPTPVINLDGATITEVACGGLHTCALDATGALWCWGENQEGQLGDGTLTWRKSPVATIPPGGAIFVAVFLGDIHSCALDSTGRLWCWGNNGSGQLGNGNLVSQSAPMLASMPSGRTFAGARQGGQHHNCAADDQGDVWCWGGNGLGQLGDGTGDDSPSPVQASLMSSSASIVSSGRYHSCVLDSMGLVWCWGMNHAGQLGNGTREDQGLPGPVVMP